VGELKGSEGETRIRVLLGANPHKSFNRFLNNYKAEFALKRHLICGAKLALCTLHTFIFIFHRPILKRRVKATKLLAPNFYKWEGSVPPTSGESKAELTGAELRHLRFDHRLAPAPFG